MTFHTIRQRRYLSAIGIETWQQRCLPETRPSDRLQNSPSLLNEQACQVPQTIVSEFQETVSILSMDWDTLAKTVQTCTACSLHLTRKKTVFGVGNRAAKWFIIAQETTEDPDPFFGPAKDLFIRMLAAIHLQDTDVYLANSVSCYPLNHRFPLPPEYLACRPYLERQIALISPKIILAMGTTHQLLDTSEPLDSLRGKVHFYGSQRIPLIPTYHPYDLLKNPQEKRKAWEDLQFAVRTFLEIQRQG